MKKLSSVKDFVLLAILLSLLSVKAYTKSHMQIALMLHKCDSAQHIFSLTRILVLRKGSYAVKQRSLSGTSCGTTPALSAAVSVPSEMQYPGSSGRKI